MARDGGRKNTRDLEVKLKRLDKQIEAVEARLERGAQKPALPTAGEPAGDGGGAYGESVVIGLAAGDNYGPQSKPFIDSLRATGYHGDIVLGVSQSTADDPGMKEYYSEQRVTLMVVAVHECSKASRMQEFGQKVCGEIIHNGQPVEVSPNLARFQFYADAVEAYQGSDLVFLSDVRDTYFQRDPFPVLKQVTASHDLITFEEEVEMFTNLQKAGKNPSGFDNTIGWSHHKEWN